MTGHNPFTEDDKIKHGVVVKAAYNEPEDTKIIVHYGGINQVTSRWNQYKFTFTSDPLPSLDTAQHLAEAVINKYKPLSLFGSVKGTPDRVKARELRSQFIRAYRTNLKTPHIPVESKIAIVPDVIEIERDDLYHTDPLFSREPSDSGRTSYMAGLSASGKTTLCTTELNRIVNARRGGDDPMVAARYMWERIFILTTSKNSEPWKDLKDPNERIRIIPFYLPKLIGLLKRINDVADNKCPFLLIFDDCFSHAKGTTFKSLALVLRNCQISSCSMSQRYNDITPGCRQSVHQTLVTRFTDADWCVIIKEQIKAEVIRLLEERHLVDAKGMRNRGSEAKLAVIFNEFVGSNIVLYDQRKRKLSLIKRDPF